MLSSWSLGLRSRASLLTVALASTLAASAACGGDDPDAGTGGTTVTHTGGSGAGGNGSGGTLGPCHNGAKDGNETDFDCGGDSCDPCGPGQTCLIAQDCAGQHCVAGKCQSVCSISGVLAYYPFEGSTDDASGNGHTGTGANLVASEGRIGGGYAFNGSNSSITIAGGYVLSSARSFCAWVKPNVASGLGQPVFTGGAPGAADFFGVQTATPLGGCGAANVPYVDHWGTGCVIGGSLTVPTGSWSHLCYVWDGSGLQSFYVDGARDQQPGVNFQYELTSVLIGAAVAGGTSTQGSFNGLIDEVAIWGRAIGPLDVTALYGGGTGCVVDP